MNEIRFAQAGETHVAYRVVEGATELDHTIVMVNGMFFPLESLFEDPIAKRLIDGLAALGRLVLFDRRGIAMSDPITDWDTPLREQWAEDLAAVVRAVTEDRVSVFSWEPFGTARTFAVDHPEMIDRLVLWNPVAPLKRSDIEAVTAAAEYQASIQRGTLDPTRRSSRWLRDPHFRDWVDAAGRLGASPATAARISEHSFGASALRTPPIDHSRVLCPTLVVVRPDAGAGNPLPADFNERAADAVPDGRLVRLTGGNGTIFDTSLDDLLAEISEFVTGSTRVPPAERVLTALLFTDLVDSTATAEAMGDEDWKRLLDQHDAVARGAVDRRGGTIVKNTGDGILATMPSVTAAIAAASEMSKRLANTSLAIRAGVHVGEVDRRGDDISGLCVNVAARIMGHAAPNQLLLSAAAAEISGEGTAASIGALELKGISGVWELFALHL